MPSGHLECAIRIVSRHPDVRGANRTFRSDVRLGRGEECEVQVDAGMVSRVHARVTWSEGEWWLVDAESTNGTYVAGESVDRLRLSKDREVQLGRDGPICQIERISGTPDTNSTGARSTGRSDPRRGETEAGVSRSSRATDSRARKRGPSERSLSQYMGHYFEGDTEDAGEHTRMIQQAYQQAKAEQRRKYVAAIGAVVMLCILLSGYTLWQHLRHDRLRKQARGVFAGMKAQEVLITKLKRGIEASSNTTLERRLAMLEEQRRSQEKRYEGFVQELGLHRDLTRKEQEIYRVARLFGESEFSIPAGFVRKVKKKIETYWLGPARSGYQEAIRRANREGYTSYIVTTFRKHGLPPELFYLALQESRFDVNAVGPKTRWGIAKGMWQFIPSTAKRYGLKVGPRVNQRVADSKDERHNFREATQAAADYLQTIYSTRAQASGLLVVASYNWGEHRIVEKMDGMPGPQRIPEGAMEGLPAEPSSRNYWAFLTEYEDRMPSETKDYVLKVFSAAVIGQAPRLFGFTFGNPVQEVLENTASSPSSRSHASHRSAGQSRTQRRGFSRRAKTVRDTSPLHNDLEGPEVEVSDGT